MLKLTLILFLSLSVLACLTNKKKSDSGNETYNTENCVENILKFDSEFGEIRNHASERISISETIDQYTKSLISLDFSNCPKAFIQAFNAHIEAWLDFKNLSDKYPELRGELHDLFNKLETGKDSIIFKTLSKPIWDTWHKVEDAAKEI